VRTDHGNLGMGKLAQPVRVAISGRSNTPGIYETLAVLGKQRSVGRIAKAIQYVRRA
jgi:glutamyl-tRNA synthetase